MVEIKEKRECCISLCEFLALENMSNFRTLNFRMQTSQQQKYPTLKKCEVKLKRLKIPREMLVPGNGGDIENDPNNIKTEPKDYVIVKQEIDGNSCENLEKWSTPDDSSKIKDLNIDYNVVEDDGTSGLTKFVKPLPQSSEDDDEISSTDRIKCKLCIYSYSTTTSLNRHVQTKHLKQKNYKCDVCNNHYSRSDLLKRHKLTHDQKRQRFPCQNCPMNFSREDYLKVHVGNVHLDIKYECNICQERFARPDLLKIHVQIKHLKAKYPCEECNMEFNWPGNLARHKSSIHDGIYKMVCKPCKRSFRDGYLLRKHYEKFHSNNKSLALKTKPNRKMVASLIKTLKKKKFLCKKCVRSFKNQDDFKRHISMHKEKSKYDIAS